jgi:mono/diheme cytochrome c family protein
MISRVASGALAGMVFAAAAPAQELGNPAAGRELATQLCTTCHTVGAERAGSDAAPPFPALAKDADTTLTELHGWSGPMHPVLSNLALTPRQIADINAYLDRLRGVELPSEGEVPRGEAEQPPSALEDAPPERIGDPIEVEPE